MTIRSRLRDPQAPGREFAFCAAAFVALAAGFAVLQAAAPFTRGWWLVAYLFLVGGLSQLLLGSGLIALARRSKARATAANARAQLVLWNAGTATVAIADLRNAPGGVLAGSLILLAALALFAVGARRVSVTARHAVRRWIDCYLALLAFLATSVVVGTALAGALPGQ